MQIVIMMDATPKRTVKKVVEAKIAANECLVCDRPAARRGLCIQHYGDYRVALSHTRHDKRHELEARWIREGRLLPSRQGQRLGAPISPFMADVQEIMS